MKVLHKDIWDPVIGEELRCEREPNINETDWYALTIKRWDNRWSSAA